MIKKTTILILFGVFMLTIKFMTVGCFAQDMHFSQFAMTPLNINPSQAGNFNEDMRVIINNRNQWRNVTSYPYKNFGASFDMSFKRTENNYFGGGVSVYSDRAGEVNLGLTSLNLSIAYHLRLSKKAYLSAGLQGGFIQSSLDETKMRFDNQFDGIGHNEYISSGETFNSFSFFNPDFAAGVLYSYVNSDATHVNNESINGKRVNIGLSINHIISPNYSFLEQKTDNLNYRYTIHTNSSFVIKGTNIAIQPSGFMAYQENALVFLLGSYFCYNLKDFSNLSAFSEGAAISLGVHYRINDALIPALLLEMGSFAVGMSYDVNISALSSVSNGRGGFEVSLRYVSPNPFKNAKSQARFF